MADTRTEKEDERISDQNRIIISTSEAMLHDLAKFLKPSIEHSYSMNLNDVITFIKRF